MSKTIKKIRRTIEKVQKRDFTQMIATCRRQPFRFRLQIAWMLVKGSPKEKKPGGVEPDKPWPRG